MRYLFYFCFILSKSCEFKLNEVSLRSNLNLKKFCMLDTILSFYSKCQFDINFTAANYFKPSPQFHCFRHFLLLQRDPLFLLDKKSSFFAFLILLWILFHVNYIKSKSVWKLLFHEEFDTPKCVLLYRNTKIE